MTKPARPRSARTAATRGAAARTPALARWDDEGGAPAGGDPRRRTAPVIRLATGAGAPVAPSSAELAHLRMRVIALENLVLAMLAAGPGRQLGSVREMAAYISPRAGCTAHPLTLKAAAQMVRLVARSADFRRPSGR
jgi:hypothetical protein